MPGNEEMPSRFLTDLIAKRAAALKYDSQSRGEAGLRPEITSKLDVMRAVFEELAGPGYSMTIVAAQEWEDHGPFSLHHTGYAVDLRTKDLLGGGYGAIAEKIAAKLKEKLGKDYFVLLHTPPAPAHIHVQFSKGRRVSSPVDYPLTGRSSTLA